ncbi:Uncharacterised protein [Sebaldella termitidis]|uniref:Uncharacterized protein n=1 Tax=Sebaldella termitidis (strain ATCC 33386 / NCTC 11300) TaxID=526218 RepID=D1AG87_SEBTE|nr:hypothetical protein [Sebaldella termitidis]ACZ10713.1 hypothetical protein Sterm_3879 [Sebaldella termitidis ATCC 33386]SUI26054.1 Uncharacterised protein [Sebaldella termitidis]
MKKFLLLFVLLTIFLTQTIICLKLNLKYRDERRKVEEIKEIFLEYNYIIYLKYEPTLFDISNRGGYEKVSTLNNLLYENEAIENIMISSKKLKNKKKIIENNIFCEIKEYDRKNKYECLELFSKITLEHLTKLKKITLKDNEKEIIYHGKSKKLWVLKISSDYYYELEISKTLNGKLNQWYSLNLPDKVYGKLTIKEYENILKIKSSNYNIENYQEIEFLKKIIPFIEFSI